ncbi:MAG: hypothetical protein ACR2KA_03890 [Opitutales bacterium]
MTPALLKASAAHDPKPPAGLSPEAKALWYTKKGDWDAAHGIAQDIETPMGSWLHALLHLIDGDLGNARYWFVEAGRPVKKPAQIDELWDEIAGEVLK